MIDPGRRRAAALVRRDDARAPAAPRGFVSTAGHLGGDVSLAPQCPWPRTPPDRRETCPAVSPRAAALAAGHG